MDTMKEIKEAVTNATIYLVTKKDIRGALLTHGLHFSDKEIKIMIEFYHGMKNYTRDNLFIGEVFDSILIETSKHYENLIESLRKKVTLGFLIQTQKDQGKISIDDVEDYNQLIEDIDKDMGWVVDFTRDHLVNLGKVAMML